jgi:outer membrane protein assembly factor BamB
MVVIDDSRGERLWTTDIQRKPVVEVGGRLLMHDTNNLYVMNPKTGETLNTLRTEKLHSVLTTPENDLIFVSPSGKMVYFSYQRGGSL